MSPLSKRNGRGGSPHPLPGADSGIGRYRREPTPSFTVGGHWHAGIVGGRGRLAWGKSKKPHALAAKKGAYEGDFERRASGLLVFPGGGTAGTGGRSGAGLRLPARLLWRLETLQARDSDLD